MAQKSKTSETYEDEQDLKKGEKEDSSDWKVVVRLHIGSEDSDEHKDLRQRG